MGGHGEGGNELALREAGKGEKHHATLVAEGEGEQGGVQPQQRGW